MNENTVHTIFVNLDQLQAFGTGRSVPGSHRKGPFSSSNPVKELQYGPPLSHIVVVSLPCSSSVGNSQKYSWPSFNVRKIQ